MCSLRIFKTCKLQGNYVMFTFTIHMLQRFSQNPNSVLLLCHANIRSDNGCFYPQSRFSLRLEQQTKQTNCPHNAYIGRYQTHLYKTITFAIGSFRISGQLHQLHRAKRFKYLNFYVQYMNLFLVKKERGQDKK